MKSFKYFKNKYLGTIIHWAGKGSILKVILLERI